VPPVPLLELRQPAHRLGVHVTLQRKARMEPLDRVEEPASGSACSV